MAPDGREYSIVVPAYNEEALLPGTLASVNVAMAALPERRGEVIVVDNASTDATARVAIAQGARVVTESHRQIARARNAGGQAAAGTSLIFLDADTRLTPELLRATLAALDDPACCGGGTLLRMEPPVRGIGQLLLRLWELISKCCGYAAGAYVFCRREAFLATGGFDERFYAAEEIHFSRALRRWGRAHGQRLRILAVPVFTSARKLQWYSTWRLLAAALLLGLCPWLLRSRRACWVWYRRPGDQETPRH